MDLFQFFDALLPLNSFLSSLSLTDLEVCTIPQQSRILKPTMSRPANKAAYLPAIGSPLEIRDAPYTSPQSGEIVVRAHAVAINPLDWIVQKQGSLIAPWLTYPFILGSDVAGEVVEIGSGVKSFKVCDRVLGHAIGFEKAFNTATQGAFQHYVVLQEVMLARIPQGMSYEKAAAIPLGASTAACGLYEPDQLGLVRPKADGVQPTGETVIIWGGSTSVGCNAIQFAAASGYEVITTCSPRNFNLVKQLGAAKAFDYNSPTVRKDILRYLSGKRVAGALSIGYGSANACISILKKCQGRKKLAMITYPGPPSQPKRFAQLQMAYYYLTGMMSIAIRSLFGGVKSVYTWGGTLSGNSLGKEIYNDYLSPALSQGSFIPAPEPQVVGNGLEDLQNAMNVQAEGVSGKKLIVLL